MNLSWSSLTLPQRNALAALSNAGALPLPIELAEQLLNLGLVEQIGSKGYCVSAKGSTVVPPTLH